LVIQIAELNRNQNAYHNEQDFSDREVIEIVGSKAYGTH
jgi:hypothetical protein